MKRMEISRSANNLLDRKHVVATANTGTYCPFTGWWESSEPGSQAVVYIWKGSTMPGHTGQALVWRLVRADAGGLLFADMQDQTWSAGLAEKGDESLWPDCQY